MNLVVVGQPAGKLAHYGYGVRNGRDPDVIAFDGAHERLSHAVALWALDWRCPGLQTQITREATRLVSDVARAVVGEPLDGAREAVHPPEPVLDSRHHKVPHLSAPDPAGCGHIAHGLAVRAVERDGDANPLAIVARHL